MPRLPMHTARKPILLFRNRTAHIVSNNKPTSRYIRLRRLPSLASQSLVTAFKDHNGRHGNHVEPCLRNPHHIRIASRYFDLLLNPFDIQLYILTSVNLVVVCTGLPIDDMDNNTERLRHLFKVDTPTFIGIDNTRDQFGSWYNFEFYYGNLKKLTDQLDSVSGKVSQKPLGTSG